MPGSPCLRRVLRPRPLECDFTRDRSRLANVAAVVVAHQIDVNVIVMIDVGARCQHGGEFIARRRLHIVQKSLLLRRAMPAILHRDLVSVGQRELGNVERIAEGVLGNVRIRIAVHAAAGISGDLFDLDDGLAKPVFGRRLHGGADPLIERGDDGAGERRRRLHFDRAGRGRHQRIARRTQAVAAAGARSHRREELADLAHNSADRTARQGVRRRPARQARGYRAHELTAVRRVVGHHTAAGRIVAESASRRAGANRFAAAVTNRFAAAARHRGKLWFAASAAGSTESRWVGRSANAAASCHSAVRCLGSSPAGSGTRRCNRAARCRRARRHAADRRCRTRPGRRSTRCALVPATPSPRPNSGKQARRRAAMARARPSCSDYSRRERAARRGQRS